FQIPTTLPPGGIQDLIGLKVTRVESLTEGLTIEGTYAETPFTAARWREFVETDLVPMAKLADGSGAVYQSGSVRYLAVWPDRALMDALICDMAGAAGIDVRSMPDGLRCRQRGDLTFLTNYGPEHIAEDTLGAMFDPKNAVAGGQGALLVGGVRIFRSTPSAGI
ncbi:MAG: beta-galactosidase trimerization domain-containing protein, partial [Pseudomonadota bacterium]